MSRKKALLITQEMKPYNNLSDISDLVKQLPPAIQNGGMDVRVLMPRFGDINERRNRLHEVVRLSGMNIVVGEEDHPLVIKVASMPGYRIQVYFLDNDDFFERSGAFRNREDGFFKDNHERLVFFCKGVIETVRKFGWPPDIIHCNGWLTSLIPMYLKTEFADDPVFEGSKLIYSAYENSFEQTLDASLEKIIPVKGNIDAKHLKHFKEGNNTELNLGAMQYADAVIKGSEELDPKVEKAFKALKDIPTLDFQETNYVESYMEFYKMLLEE